jgi:hypothetical protein
MMRIGVLLGVLVACACASDPATKQASAKDESARLTAPEVPLTTYGKFELPTTVVAPEVASHAEKVPVAADVGQKLQASLQPMLQAWESSAPEGARGKVLVIRSTIRELKVVNAGAFRSAWAGDSYVTLDLALVDKDSGKVIAAPTIKKTASGWAGAFTAGSTDVTLADLVVQIARQYLEDHHKP